MSYRLSPLESLGPIHFGMSREEVRAVLGKPHAEQELPNGLVADHYTQGVFRVFYLAGGDFSCVAVDLLWPQQVEWEGQPLLGRTAGEVLPLLRAADPGLLARRGKILSERLGIEYRGHDLHQEGRPLRYVTVFGEGYPVDRSELTEPEHVELWVYEPKVALGPIRFGMTRQEVHAALREATQGEVSFRPVTWDPDVELCEPWGARLSYRPSSGRLFEIELLSPPDHLQVVMFGRRLLWQDEEELQGWLSGLDGEALFEERMTELGAFGSYRYGLFFNSRHDTFSRVDTLILFTGDSRETA